MVTVPLARPRISASQSRLRPSQSRGFWAKPGRNITSTERGLLVFYHVCSRLRMPLHNLNRRIVLEIRLGDRQRGDNSLRDKWGEQDKEQVYISPILWLYVDVL